MKPSKLYIRIFISFLILLIITEIAIFGFFVAFSGQRIHDYYKEYGQIRFDMARDMTEYQLSRSPVDFTRHTPAFQEFIDHLGVAFKTKIWITDSNGQLLYNSFDEKTPMSRVKHILEKVSKNEAYFQRYSQLDIYKSGPINMGKNQPLTLHVLFDDRPPFKHIDGFAYGLILIGFIVALMTFPIARRISKPIKTLTESTKRLEIGDLSHRTTVSSKDEIGELATAFNRMAGKLERIVKTGKEMTAQVSHELRSPLARIQIAVEILKDRFVNLEDDTTGQLKTIQMEIDELDRIIGRILELSKLDLKDDAPYSDVFSPNKILIETLLRFEAVLRNKKIKVEKDLASEDKIIGNKEAFSTAINNLLDNISKYTPTQGKVQLKTYKQENDLEIVLINSGTQLAEEDLRKIFDPFVRITTDGESGVGLGLSITKKIVEKHGGKIKAVSTPSGFEIRISVPVVRLD